MSEGREAADPVEIPAPLALHDYFRLLDDFASARPCRNAYIGELLSDRGWGARERSEYEQGQSSLWRLIPPITLEELAEADFDPPAFMALALAVVVWGRHALHYHGGGIEGRRMPKPLPAIERISRFVAEHIEQAGRRSSRGAIGRLDALRQDLQTVRLDLEAAAREQATPADGVQDGIASARSGDSASGVLRWLPRRFRKATEPGLELLRRVTSPGMALSLVTGGTARKVEWAVDVQVPPPLGLYDYVQALGDHAAGKRLQQVFLHGLIQSVGLSEPLMTLFATGRNGLWILIPPITATSVQESNLDVAAARALGVALLLRAEHALLHYKAEQPNGRAPPVLEDCGEVLTVLKLALENGRDADEDPVVDALMDVARRLAARGISAGGVVDQRLDDIREVRRQDAETRREEDKAGRVPPAGEEGEAARLTFSVLRGARLWRMVAGLVLIGALACASFYLRSDQERLPSAATYTSVPAVAIIRHQDEIVVRVPPSFMARPVASREASLRSLYARFAKELGAEAVPILIVSLKNEPYGGVAGQRVWWEAPTPEQPPGNGSR